MVVLNLSSSLNIIVLFYAAFCSGTFSFPSAISVTKCYTASATTSVRPVPTTTISGSTTILYPVILLKQPTTTEYPPPNTATETETTTSVVTSEVPQETDIMTIFEYTTTTEVITLPTTTITQTTGTTTTSTQTIDVLTIPSPTNFRPVLDTLPNSVPKKRYTSADLTRGSLVARAALYARTDQQSTCPIIPKNGAPLPRQYPKSVTCYAIKVHFVAQTTTRLSGETVTITAPVSTSSITVTETETSLDVATTPNAQTTITETSTITEISTYIPSTTTTTTLTATIVVQTARATAYAQCAPDSRNYAGGAYGRGFARIGASDGAPVQYMPNGAPTREACCTTCALNPYCQGTFFYRGFQQGQQCYIITSPFTPGPNVCSTQAQGLFAGVDAYYPVDGAYIVSNGGCGNFMEARPAGYIYG